MSDKNGPRGWLRHPGFVWSRKAVADPRLSQYFHLRIEELLYNGACRLTGLILGEMAVLGDKLRNLTADLNRLAEEFCPPKYPDAQNATEGDPEHALLSVAETIGPEKMRLIAEMEHDLEQNLVRVASTDGADVVGVLSPVLRPAARAAIHRMLKKATLREIVASSSDGSHHSEFSLGAALKAATPPLRRRGEPAPTLSANGPRLFAVRRGAQAVHRWRLGVADSGCR